MEPDTDQFRWFFIVYPGISSNLSQIIQANHFELVFNVNAWCLDDTAIASETGPGIERDSVSAGGSVSSRLSKIFQVEVKIPIGIIQCPEWKTPMRLDRIGNLEIQPSEELLFDGD